MQQLDSWDEATFQRCVRQSHGLGEQFRHRFHKSEARMSKLETNANDKMVEGESMSVADVLSIWIFTLVLVLDFDIRISNFASAPESDATMQLRLRSTRPCVLVARSLGP